MKIVSQRTGKVIEFGSTMGLTLREELAHCGADIGDSVQIQVLERDSERCVRIKKLTADTSSAKK